jgi:hypothetical protein
MKRDWETTDVITFLTVASIILTVGVRQAVNTKLEWLTGEQ